jgi:hypothetical protein
MYAAPDKDQWQALVNTVMTFKFHGRWVTSQPADQLLAPQRGLSSEKLKVIYKQKQGKLHPVNYEYKVKLALSAVDDNEGISILGVSLFPHGNTRTHHVIYKLLLGIIKPWKDSVLYYS